MILSNTTSKNGILQHIEDRINAGDGGITGDATKKMQFISKVNIYKKRANMIAITADGRWRWDDSNYTDEDVATTDLAIGQTDYGVMNALPSSGQDWLQVVGVNVKDESGTFYKLRHQDRADFAQPLSERVKTTGQPMTYDFKGTQIYLDATPSYASTGGLQILFDRASYQYAVDGTDDAKATGYPSIFDEYFILGPVYLHEKYKNVSNSEQTKRDIQEMENNMAKFFGNRDQYEVNKLRRPYSTMNYR